MRKKILRSENGITMVTLVTTIVLMMIISSMVVYYSLNSISLDKINKLYADIQTVQDKVDIYYAVNGVLPVKDGAEEVHSSDGKVFGIDQAVNDSDLYYEIDLGIIELGQSDLNNYSTENYFVNSDSHVVYSKKGVEVDGNEYHRLNVKYVEVVDGSGE